MTGRVEHKFQASDAAVQGLRRYLLPHLTPDPHGRDYRVTSTYYDTPEYDFYWDHRAGVADRYKLRARTYNDEDFWFYEQKRKADGLSFKDRMARAAFAERVDSVAAQKVVKLRYDREAYVGIVGGEPVRVTIDAGVRFKAKGGDWSPLVGPSVRLVEVKTPSFQSDFADDLADRLKLEPLKFSKYCTAIQRMHGGSP